MKTELGKITQVNFGFGGYQGAQFGVSFILSGENLGCCDLSDFGR